MKYIYVDNSNLFICGQYLSAWRNPRGTGIERDKDGKPIDLDWRIDYQKLHGLLCGGDKSSVKCAKLWGSEPPDHPFWQMVEKAGFEAEHWPRNSQNKEKGIDTAIALEMGIDSGSMDKSTDEIIVVSADEDIIKAAKKLRQKGFKVTIYAWKYNVAQALKADGLVFIDLTPHFDQISL